MLDKLKLAEQRYAQLEAFLAEPRSVGDRKRYRDDMREYKSLGPLIEKYREYKKAEESLSEAKGLLSEDGTDADLREMALSQLDESRALTEQYGEELKALLLPRDPDDDRNVIIEIRGGAGGEESALFVGSLYRMYSMYAALKNWKIEVVGSNPTELGGYKEIGFSVQGEGAYAKMKYESGVHRVQRVPETEAQGRVHTSTVTVAVLPEAEEIDVEINPADLEVQTFRASGAGGQHINKTESAIRVIHKPSGTVVECQDERSQHKNKSKAMKMLYSKLYEIKSGEQTDKIAAERRIQVGTGDRSERIRTYNYPQGRVTDHRIGLTLYKLEAVLNGECDEIFEALAVADKAAKLTARD
ncbi:MAG: peptide chain release factor 1 [Oscillospiraceae bacterium]|jgi:peptide chain release factor 1|nr:peptide chain release factor 1 [Oscillospiraceae bacterium]